MGKQVQVVYNACFGGFSLSKEAVLRARDLGAKWAYADTQGGECNLVGETYVDGSEPFACAAMEQYHLYETARHDPVLVQVVKELGDQASGNCASLKIATVRGPYRVDEYDGNESIVQPDEYEWIDGDSQ